MKKFKQMQMEKANAQLLTVLEMVRFVTVAAYIKWTLTTALTIGRYGRMGVAAIAGV